MEKDDADFMAAVRARVAALGFDLVDLKRRGAGQRRSLQVRIDRPNSTRGHGVTADDCAVASRALESWLDDSGVLGGRYVLEVSSPGIERPIRWIEHWRRFTGSDVRVRLPGSGRIEATIVRVEQDGRVVLRPRGAAEEITVLVEEARDATLVVDWSEVDRAFTGTKSEESA